LLDVYDSILPDNLPPTHRGKVFKIVYKLLVAVKNRKGSTLEAQELKLPIKVFNRVSGTGEGLTFDSRRPIVAGTDSAIVYCLEERQQAITFKTIRLSKYITQLHSQAFQGPEPSSATAAATTAPSPSLRPPSSSVGASGSSVSPTSSRLPSLDKPLEGMSLKRTTSELSTASAASSYNNFEVVDIPRLDDFLPPYSSYESLYNINTLCQSSSPLYFHIKSQDLSVARFALHRDAVRLGDVVHALIDFSGAGLRCLHVSATIEQHEVVESIFANKGEDTIRSISMKVRLLVFLIFFFFFFFFNSFFFRFGPGPHPPPPPPSLAASRLPASTMRIASPWRSSHCSLGFPSSLPRRFPPQFVSWLCFLFRPAFPTFRLFPAPPHSP